MKLTKNDKQILKNEIISCLAHEQEVKKIVLFGSFSTSPNPNDIDVAIFQDSTEGYLPLAMKYRKNMRQISKRIPIDIFPIKIDVKQNVFLSEINKGETIYER